MFDELVTLPVRVGVRFTRLWFRALEEAFSVTSSATERAIGLLASRSVNGETGANRPGRGPDGARDRVPASEDGKRAPSGPSQMRERAVSPTPVARTPPAPEPEATPESAHVSEEPRLVGEFAESGAAEGAGPEIHVDPPWNGYEQMSAKQVISRFAAADAAELAAVQLYESSHRRRRTILNAVEHELHNANGGSSPG